MKRYQYAIVAIVFPFAVLACINALVRNPSVPETNAKFSVMKEAMDALLAHGGRVVRSYENSKYGGALLSETISDEGWSQALLRDYQKTLEMRGWKRMKDTEIIYCKDGMQATLRPNDGVLDGTGINNISMTYNAQSIKRCGAA